ncbi:hypothetical protein C0Q70_03462 [Pomacea canaliculata]|uniref:Uncharacterized protein n=1 Tax=Pomacea canaliculata TaxID=400727 RepID=A0A2T7PSS6_POMCA|nr:hypothetical protein C0Q70_03462 [Pomacea canaliculata]
MLEKGNFNDRTEDESLMGRLSLSSALVCSSEHCRVQSVRYKSPSKVNTLVISLFYTFLLLPSDMRTPRSFL